MYESRLTPDERATIQRRCVDALKVCTVGVQEPHVQNGLDFYKYFFTNFPYLRVYFKGAEHFTADDVQRSERFAKQGQRILLAVHLTVMVFTDDAVFQAYVRETVTRHRQFRMDPALWSAFWNVWVGYLAERSGRPLDEPVRKAWAQLGDEFSGVARDHLKASGLPY